MRRDSVHVCKHFIKTSITNARQEAGTACSPLEVDALITVISLRATINPPIDEPSHASMYVKPLQEYSLSKLVYSKDIRNLFRVIAMGAYGPGPPSAHGSSETPGHTALFKEFEMCCMSEGIIQFVFGRQLQ